MGDSDLDSVGFGGGNETENGCVNVFAFRFAFTPARSK